MGKLKVLTEKILFGMLFIIVIPLLLGLWSKQTGVIIKLPVPQYVAAGYVLIIAGALFIISGMLHLMVIGKGLPMNPYPPQRLVKVGIYSITKHPIYAGAVMIAFGCSIVFQSPSGFWLVSPLFAMMTAAYVVGFENERTEKIFGQQDYKTILSLPSSDEARPSAKNRISAFLNVYVPWVIVYEAFVIAGIPKGALCTNLSFEKNIPVIEFTEVIYLSTYLFAILIPFVINRSGILRRFITDLWFATIITAIIYFVFPFIVSQREFIPRSLLGRIIIAERSLDSEAAALPSFHVIWAFIAAFYFSSAMKNFRILWYGIAVLIAASCVTTGNHSIPDVIAGFLVFIVVIYKMKIWNYIKYLAEKLANSWKEWRAGPLRIINHGLYGGAAGLAGNLIAGFFLGPKYAIAGFIVLIFVIIGAGLWAQIIEGSSKLLRPYGYYGGLTGGLITCGLVSLIFHINIFLLLGSFALAGPWIQAIGRLRCLIQGCCHGRPSNETLGIRFIHPLSRVNKISGLKGLPVHPTQLYSIGNNIVSGLILIRLYTLEMPAIFIVGIYFILNGLGRFVEESFRGEAQTPYWKGMRIYQWIALINIVAGAVCTCIHDTTTLTFQFNTLSIFLSVAMYFIVAFASGVDFPESDKRFARLTSN